MQVFDLEAKVLDLDFTLAGEGELASGNLILPLARLDELAQISGKKGLLIKGGDAIEDMDLPLDQIDLIQIHFENFNDGRGYSIAHLLRRAGFTGDLLASGDVFKDVVFYLKRAGFNLFAPRDEAIAQEAAAGLSTFSKPYQASTAERSDHYQTGS